MSRKLLVATSILAVAAVANAQLSPYVQPYYEGPLPDAGDYVFSFDLVVSVPEADAWCVAGGPSVGEPWIVIDPVHGGTFFQSPCNDGNPPNPLWGHWCPDSEYTSFYTTHLGYPNVPDMGLSPGFAYGPADTDHELVADWFWTPDGNDYPGDFIIARFTVIPDDISNWWAYIDMQVGSREGGVIPFQATVGIPEPTSLALLALGGLALLRRR